jgi:hypothetical protein
VYQVVEELHTASLTDGDSQTAKIVTPVGSQWVSLQLFNDDAENSHSYHVHMMLTAGNLRMDIDGYFFIERLLSQLQTGSPVSVTESNLPTGAATAGAAGSSKGYC